MRAIGIPRVGSPPGLWKTSVATRFRHPLGGPWSGSKLAYPVAGTAWRATVPEGPCNPHGRDARLARVEAVLLLSREPLGSRKIGKLAGLADGTEARTLIRQLNRCYDGEGTAFRAEEVAGGFQLLTRPEYSVWLRRWRPPAAESRLSGPALETLAVVAYRQPVLRADIEAIRGVQCGEMLRQLMERDLVRIVGRGKELGRPFLYGVTKRFLDLYGLRDLDDLPRAEQLRGPGRPAGLALAPDNQHTTEAGAPDKETTSQGESEEFAVSKPISLGIDRRRPADSRLGRPPVDELSPLRAKDEEEEWEDEDDDDGDDDDSDDEDDEEDDDEEGFEEDEWEEVDDEDDDEDEEEDEEEWDEEEDEEWDEEEEEEWDEDDDEDDDEEDDEDEEEWEGEE